MEDAVISPPHKPRHTHARIRVRRSVWLPALIAAAVVAAIVLLIYLRKQAPPEPARLLPEADAIVYVNLKPARLAHYFAKHPVSPDADYAAFQSATGIVLERDLDEAAFAIHVLPSPVSIQGPVGFSEVFTGHFDARRLGDYLQSQSNATESYGGKTIYSIPHDGRIVRATILAYDTVAASNMPTTEQVHHIVDAYRSSALPFSGPTLLRENYSDVPLLSFAWGIGRISAPFTRNGHFTVFGIPLPVPANATFVVSARMLTAIHLRVEEIAPTESSAQLSATALKAMVSLVSSEQRVSNALTGSTDPDMAALLKSVNIEQKKNRAVVTVSIPPSLAGRLLDPKKQ